MALGLAAAAWPAVQAAASEAESTPPTASVEAAVAVTPYRPSVSTPAALSAPGWLEFELGASHALAAGGLRRSSAPVTVKLALSEDWGLRVSGDAWVRLRDGTSPSLSGGGDLGVVIKRRFAFSEQTAFGLEAGATLPVGRSGIGSGASDLSLNAIYSADWADPAGGGNADGWHTDVNWSVTRIGAPEAGAGRMQSLWAAALSRSLSARWGMVGELSGTRQRGLPGTCQALLAASYSVSKWLVLDAGALRGLCLGNNAGRAVFTGVTVLGPRLF